MMRSYIYPSIEDSLDIIYDASSCSSHMGLWLGGSLQLGVCEHAVVLVCLDIMLGPLLGHFISPLMCLL